MAASNETSVLLKLCYYELRVIELLLLEQHLSVPKQRLALAHILMLLSWDNKLIILSKDKKARFVW